MNVAPHHNRPVYTIMIKSNHYDKIHWGELAGYNIGPAGIQRNEKCGIEKNHPIDSGHFLIF